MTRRGTLRRIGVTIGVCLTVFVCVAPRASAQNDEPCAELSSEQPLRVFGARDGATVSVSRSRDVVRLDNREVQGVLGPVAAIGDAQIAVVRHQFSLARGKSARAVVTSGDPEAVFSLAVYRCDGTPLRATVAASVEPELFLQGSDDVAVSGVIEVILENPEIATESSAAESDVGSDYRLRLREAIGGRADGSVLARGREFLSGLGPEPYELLVNFARCDSVRPEHCVPVCTRSCWQTASRIVAGLVGVDPTADEPIVAFVGLAGADRIVRVSPHVPPHFRSLDRAHSLWVVYIEDIASPFRTSIDVEFRRRADARDFESFDPTGQRLRAAALSEATRVVRVGVRRVRIRQPPTDIQVTFTRSGAGYGLRQWQRAYRVANWWPFSFGAGLFVPGNEPGLETVDLEVPTLADGSVPDFQVIVPGVDYRRVFMTGLLRWNRPREKIYDLGLDSNRILWMLVPEVVVGLGLPSTGNIAFYTGLNWPVVSNVGVSIGVAHLHQRRLLPGFEAGDRLPWPPWVDVSDITSSEWFQRFTFGVTYDFLGLR